MKLSHLFIVLALVLLGLGIVFKSDSISSNPIASETVILAFGDSLTYGKGAEDQSYPMQLQTLINIKVINAGQSGEPSTKGLERLPALLKKYKPSLVILCHGGNDIIRKTSKQTLKDNLIKMIRLSKQAGAQVLLVGVPDFKMIRFNTEGLYEEIAEQEQVLYEGEVLEDIENNNDLKSDRIHPNAQGYALMAKAFAEVLKENGILR